MARIMIIDAKAVGKLSVELKFNDNTIQCINVGDFITRNPHLQYDKYLDEAEFRKFIIDDGNIVWGEDWDLIFPIEQLHSGVIC